MSSLRARVAMARKRLALRARTQHERDERGHRDAEGDR
jgi:hypothetical protein